MFEHLGVLCTLPFEPLNRQISSLLTFTQIRSLCSQTSHIFQLLFEIVSEKADDGGNGECVLKN